MEMPKEGKEEVQIINEVIILDKLRHCPDCKEKNIISLVERIQYEEDRYWVYCTRGAAVYCSFLEECIGKPVINKDDLTKYGLPGQLAEHMDIFYEDINKIVRLCMSECIKMSCWGVPMTDFDLKGFKESVNTLAKDHVLVDFPQPMEPIRTRAVKDDVSEPHNLHGVGQPIQPIKIHECDLTAEKNLASTLASFQHVGGFNEPSPSTKTNECDLTAEEKLVGTLADFQDLGGLSQPPLLTNLNECDLLGNEVLIKLCYNLDFFRQPLRATNMNDGKLALFKDRESKFERSLNNSKEFYRQPKRYSVRESLEKLANSLVADLPFHYQEQIKIAFSKIKGYNFPGDFLSMTSPDKHPLFKIIEEIEKERIKVEMNEQLRDFMDEFDGIKELFK